MNVGVIGSGGREHALVWKLRQSPSVEKLYAVPGSAAMADLAECVPLPVSDLAGITDYAVRQNIDLLVVGPEVPLIEGIADLAEEKGIAVFGPSKAAARLEGSKSFAKMLMKKYGIPTADYESFTDGAAAKAYIKEKGSPIVVKADGLAAGKGVVVAMTTAEALAAVDAMMEDKIFGDSGGRIVVEEYMSGEEASILAFVDGETIVPMPAAQDHKRIFDGDKGPNTGGMGAYAPAPAVTEAIYEEVTERILKPTVAALAAEGILYRGCLYAGLMLTTEGVKVVEFNCRFGDPETQAVLPLIDGDLAEIMYACAKGKLDAAQVRRHDGAACCVVMAAAGYPESSHGGDVINGLDKAAARKDTVVFHSGTAVRDGAYVTSGGRVLGVTALAGSLREAVDKAYAAVGDISFNGQQVRSDIGKKGLDHLQ